jgi:hypothetical protein
MNKNNFENYYQILGLPDFASIEEIKKAFRELTKKHHPDRGGDPEKFKKILEAYKILYDKEKKKQFDEYLFNYKSRNNFTAPQDIDQNINTISIKEPVIIKKTENILRILLVTAIFFSPFFSTSFVLIKNEGFSGGILFLGLLLGFITLIFNLLITFVLLYFYEYSEKLINSLTKNYNTKLRISSVILGTICIFISASNFLVADRIVLRMVVGEDLNKSKSINSYQKIPNAYSKNSFLGKKENKTIFYEDAIENYWDDIKEYVDGYTTIETCSDSGCYDLEAYISNGKIDEIYFPNGGYLYFDTDINSDGQASDMDQNGNWWDFSIDMDSSIINDAVSDWASDNGFEIY